jgi:dihydroflavonol-4-reductase
MKALVTGGTGFIGSHVARKLIAEKVPVRCLVRDSSKRANLAGLDVDYVTGDLTDAASLKHALVGCDTLFHVAADYRLWAPKPEDMDRINVEGTRDLMRAAADAGVKKIVYTSSVAAVGRLASPSPELRTPSPLSRERVSDSPSPYLREKGLGDEGEGGLGYEGLDPTPAHLIGPYKKSKFASELVARDFAAQGLPIVIVNPSAPIGSHDIKPTPTGKMIVDFLNGKMPAYIDTGMNFIAVEDVAAGHWLACQKGRVGERYILGHKNMTLKAFLDTMARLSGRPAPRIRIPYAVAYLAGAVSTGLSRLTRREPTIPLDGVRMAHEPMYYDASKAVRELGLPQTPIEEAIRQAIEWFRANGYIRG